RAERFDSASVGAVDVALGDRDRPLEGADDVCDRDVFGGAGEAESTLGAAVRHEKPLTSENLQDLAHGRERQVRRARELRRVSREPLRMTSEVREQHDPVIRESRYADHLGLVFKEYLNGTVSNTISLWGLVNLALPRLDDRGGPRTRRRALGPAAPDSSSRRARAAASGAASFGRR